MYMKKIFSLIMASMIMLAPIALAASAAEVTTTQEQTAANAATPNETTTEVITATTPDTPTAAETTAAPTSESAVVQADADASSDKAPADGSDISDALDPATPDDSDLTNENTPTDATTPAPEESSVLTPETTAAPIPVVPAEVYVNTQVTLNHRENAVYAAGLFKKDLATGVWTLVAQQDITDTASVQTPSVLIFDPDSRKEHGSLTLEINEKNQWEITKESYYSSELMIIPVIIVTFLITLALSVVINMFIIKLHKR